jgi:signal transduction histidine kinase/CheY-like chemotaxis protein
MAGSGDAAQDVRGAVDQFRAACAESLGSREVASVLAGWCRARFGARKAWVAVLAEGRAAVEVLAAAGADEEQPALGRRFPITSGTPWREVITAQVPAFLASGAETVAAYPAAARTPLAEGSAAAIPLFVDDRHIGGFGMLLEEGRVLDAGERALLIEVAGHAARVLVRAGLYDVARAARFDAESAARGRDDFLAHVGHELRTPLTAILGWTSLVRDRAGDRAAVEHALAVIERNAQAQVKLVDDLMEASRVSLGKVSLALRAVDAAALVTAAVDAVRPAAAVAGVSLALEMADDVGCIEADPERILQVAQNLLTNAVKFSLRGGRVEVRLDRAEDRARLRVSDEGQGIDPAFLPHVFERYTQAERGRGGPARAGLGLGLAIVRHLVELHDGTVTVESEGLGRGATFTVVLPAAADPEAERRSSPDALREKRRLEGVRLVLVDDDADTRALMAAVLREQGALLTLAGNADEGLRAVLQSRPDALVTDLGMPEEDGFALLRRVRAVRPLPALAVTAYVGPQDARMVELAGFDAYLAKPFVPKRLVEAVERITSRAR